MAALKQKAEFACFLFALERKFSPQTTSTLLHLEILGRIVSVAKGSHLDEEDKLSNKQKYEVHLKLISLYCLLQTIV